MNKLILVAFVGILTYLLIGFYATFLVESITIETKCYDRYGNEINGLTCYDEGKGKILEAFENTFPFASILTTLVLFILFIIQNREINIGD